MSDLRNSRPIAAADFSAADPWSPSNSSSVQVLADILADAAAGRRLQLLDLGCGNGQFARYLFDYGLTCDYTGVDISEPLLEAGRKAFARNDHVHFIHDDIEVLDNVTGSFDFVIYSHTIEMLASPERSLHAARKFADRILIRFFEPPIYESTTVELSEMHLGKGAAPHVHWKMGKSFYRLMLAELDAKRVDIYRTPTRDQVHLLRL
jgi:SAM-dependent methyltransferase